MGYPPVVVVESGGVPRTQVAEGVSAPAFTVVESGARPITLAENAPPIALFNTAGDHYVDPIAVLNSIEWDQVNYPLAPEKTGDVWISGLNPDDYLPLSGYTGTPLFVDQVSGSDAANGQAGTPVKSLHRAIALINTAMQPTHVTVLSGSFPRTNSFNSSGSVVLNYPAWFECEGGGRAVVWHGDVLTWASAGSGAYSATRSSVARVVDTRSVNVFGDYPDLIKVADLAACQALPGSWAQVTTTLYVHLSDSAAVTNANTKAFLTTNAFRTTAPLRLTNFDLEGGGGEGGCLSLQGITGDVIVENCTFKYPGRFSVTGIDNIDRDCWFADDCNGLVAFIDSGFSSASKDGGNADWKIDSTRSLFVLTERCSGANFGGGGSLSSNGITGHGTVVWADIDSDYTNGGGGLVRFIEDSRIAAFGSRYSFDLGDGVNTPGVVRMDGTAEARLVECVVTSGGEATLLTSTDGIIWTTNVTQTGGVASGDIRPF